MPSDTSGALWPMWAWEIKQSILQRRTWAGSFQDNFVSDHSREQRKQIQGQKFVSFAVCSCEDFSVFAGRRNKPAPKVYLGWRWGGKKWDAQITGGGERLEPQVRHAGSGDSKFPVGIESGDWNPNEAILYSIHGTIHLYLEFLPFEVTDFSKISQIKYE